MKRSLIIAIAFFVLLTQFSGIASNVAAQESKQIDLFAVPSAVLLADDFEAYSTFPAGTWVNSNATTAVWSIASNGGSNTARQTANASTYLVTNGDIAWANYRVSARVKPGVLGFRNGIVGRFTNTSGYYRLYLNSTASGSTKNIVLEKRVGSSNIGLQTIALPAIVAGTFYKLTLEVIGSSIRGYVDDTLRIQVVDSDYPTGNVGFYNSGDTYYDDLIVDDLSYLPNNPSNLVATGGTGQVSLTWNSVNGATSYNVKRGTVSGGPYSTISTPTTTGYSDITAVPGTSYFYVVTATNAGGESPNSNQATGTAIPLAPSAPTGLTATAGGSQISLSWTAVSGATGYNVNKSTTNGGPYTTLTSVTNATYTDTAVSNGTAYYYVVTATNSAGESPNSNQASATPVLGVPGVPGSVESASGDREARIYWVASSGIVNYYDVYRSLTSSGGYSRVATNITALEYTDTGLTNNTRYYYRIIGVNAAGDSAFSGPRNADPRLGVIVNVSTDAQLATAFANAVSGDEIILANGNYLGIKMRRRYGTPTKPVVVRSQNPLGAVFNAGQFELDRTDYITVKDFKFTLSNEIKLRGTEYCRLTGNSFEFNEAGITDRDWISLGSGESNHNRIDHNDFKNKVTLGNFITQVGSLGQISQYDLIDHNYFFNLGPRADNEKEAIRLGDSSVSTSSGFAIVEYNLFEQCDGDAEIVSIKTHDNIARYNTFRRSKGALTSRQGNRNQMYGNFFFGEGVAQTGGIRAYGDDHKIYNNYFEGLTASDTLPSENYGVISLTGGDADGAELPGADQSKHYRPQRILVANNTLVGNNYGIEMGGSYTLPPRDITISNNVIVGSTNKLVNLIAEPINPTYSGNIAFPTGTATVGITATAAQIAVADPLLLLQNGIYLLGEGSPAIDASAVNYAFITDDIEGQVRDERHDVGADEFGGPAPQRLPLLPSNSGRNATGLSISGRIVTQTGQGIPAVTVTLNPGGSSPTLVGTTAATLLTDAAGYYNFTDVVPGMSYSGTVSKTSYAFTPNTFSVPSLNSDTNFSPLGTNLAPTAATVRIAGRVGTEYQQPLNAVVKLIAEDGSETAIPTSSFGYFSFENVLSGQTYILSVTSKLRSFAPQVLSVTDDLTEIVISPIQ